MHCNVVFSAESQAALTLGDRIDFWRPLKNVTDAKAGLEVTSRAEKRNR